MTNAKLILLIGQYAQNYYLGKKVKSTLTESVRSFKEYLPYYFLLPHPSPRNNIWQAKNDWFGLENLPELRKHIRKIINPEENPDKNQTSDHQSIGKIAAER